MPIYEYEHKSGACEFEHAPSRFEELQSIKAAALAVCPKCGQPVHRVISLPSKPGRLAGALSPSNLAEKGFTQYKRADKGVYERTAGEGGPARLDITGGA